MHGPSRTASAVGRCELGGSLWHHELEIGILRGLDPALALLPQGGIYCGAPDGGTVHVSVRHRGVFEVAHIPPFAVESGARSCVAIDILGPKNDQGRSYVRSQEGSQLHCCIKIQLWSSKFILCVPRGA